MRQLLSLVLERAGFEVLAASRGQEALNSLQSSSPPINLLLTDIDMPGMTGVELGRLARHASPALPVLLMSGTPMIVALEGPGWEFLPKPFVPDVLVGLLQRMLGGAASVNGASGEAVRAASE